MTTFRFVTLMCDECGCVYDVRGLTVPATRALAAAAGWEHRRGPGPHETGPGPGVHLDYCAKCAAQP